MQTSGVLLKAVETEIKATAEVLKKYSKNCDNIAVTRVREIAEALQIDSGLAESRSKEKKECLDMMQRTKFMKCHKKTSLQQICFCR